MRTWLKKWYGRTVDDEHMGHHLHGKVRKLTRVIIRAQQREIGQM